MIRTTLIALFALSLFACKGSGNGPAGSTREEKLDFECASKPVNKYMYYYSDKSEPNDPAAQAAGKAAGCDDKGSIGIPGDPTHKTYQNCWCCPKP